MSCGCSPGKWRASGLSGGAITSRRLRDGDAVMTEGAVYLRASEIAHLLGMAERTVRRWIADETPSDKSPSLSPAR